MLYQQPGYVLGNEMLQFGTQFCVYLRNANQNHVSYKSTTFPPASTVAEWRPELSDNYILGWHTVSGRNAKFQDNGSNVINDFGKTQK